jgi:AcrR family transcriptional regulator
LGEILELDSGRTQQKYRTRRALLAATRRLMDRNQPISIQTAADEADISRATAYRYFTSVEYLMREALLDGAWEKPEVVVGESQDIRERVRRVQAYLFAFTRRNEAAHRLFLAKALEAWVEQGNASDTQLRGARRLPMFELALAPLNGKLPPEQIQDLVMALAAASGIETYIALKDVCGLDDQSADRIAERNIAAILDQALSQGS